jgi:hypothetical protein
LITRELVIERPEMPRTEFAHAASLSEDRHQLGFALGETLAHLNLLVERGDIERRLDDEGRLSFRTR